MSRLLLGFDFDGRPIWTPDAGGSRIVFAAAGGGKTTCVAVPSILCAIADTDTAVIINDVKQAEITSQIEPVCVKHGRFFAVVDDFGIMEEGDDA